MVPATASAISTLRSVKVKDCTINLKLPGKLFNLEHIRDVIGLYFVLNLIASDPDREIVFWFPLKLMISRSI